jgi:hypothetical protein
MGRTATEWVGKVAERLLVAGQIDIDNESIAAIGVLPALSQYAIDRPRTVVVDIAPSGRYLPLPTAGQGWVTGWSQILQIESPAGQTPPQTVDPLFWTMTRDATSPTIERVLLPDTVSGALSRVYFTSTWPAPGVAAATDLVSDAAFEAVAALAASNVCLGLAAEASRSRQGAIPTDFVDGTERARNLQDVAASLRVVYNTFIGLGQGTGVGTAAGGGATESRVLRSTRMK